MEIIQVSRVEDYASANDVTRDWFNWIFFVFSSVPCGFLNLLKYYQPQVWLLHSDGDAKFSSKFGQSSLYACEVIEFQPATNVLPNQISNYYEN